MSMKETLFLLTQNGGFPYAGRIAAAVDNASSLRDPIHKETTMSEDVYYKLGERLNEYPVKMPLVDAFLDILREYYTEEQAALGAAIPKGNHLARDLAKQLNRDEQELVASLETMADSGLIFTAKNDAGETEYSLTPFVPGVWEFQLMKGTDTEHDRRAARMMYDFGKTLEELDGRDPEGS